MTGTYIQPLDIPENELNQKLKTNQLIYFYNLTPNYVNVLFLDSSGLLFLHVKQQNIDQMWIKKFSDVNFKIIYYFLPPKNFTIFWSFQGTK